MSDPRSREDVFNRPPRIYRAWRAETIDLPEPPVPLARNAQPGLLTVGMPLLSAGVMVGATAAISQGGHGLLFGVPMAAMAAAGVATTLVAGRAQARRDAADFAQRRAFFAARVAERQARIQELYDEEQRIRREAHPPLEQALRIAGALGSGMLPLDRLWERRIGDPDFLELAVGSGRVPFSTAITVPTPQRESAIDPRLFALQQRYQMLDDVPIAIPLAQVGSLGIAGPRAEALAMLHALIWQAAIFHAPGDLRMAATYPADAAPEWDWISWLPHTIPLNNDAAFSVRMHASDDAAVNQLMSTLLDQLSRRRDQQAQGGGATPAACTPILAIVDGVERVRDQPVLSAILRDGPRYNILALFLVERWADIPSECGAMLDLGSDGPRWARAGREWSREPFRVDVAEATVAKSDRLARRLASIKLAESGSNQDVPRNVRLFELLGIEDESDLKPPVFWGAPPPAQRAWRADAPIGQRAGQQPLCIDLYEQAHGPHGIIAGATGAGKSVLLQCVIASLAITHSPVQMQLLLIDFKGGASLAQLARLPHTVGFVTDLEGRLAERAMTAIKSEIQSRKRLFRAAEAQLGSKVENIHEYREKAAPGLPPLPNLLIVIDEFDELAQSYKAFVAELVRVVKQGRSLGVHLLLASQQPAKAVTDDIRTQLKFFIALRLGGSEDSREMLQKPDAAFLPTDIPGRSYFRVGSETTLFQVAQVTGAYRPKGKIILPDELDDDIVFHEPSAQPSAQPGAQPGAARQLTDLDVLVRALAEAGADFLRQERERSGWQPRPIWQPPLGARLALSEILPESSRAALERRAAAWPAPAPESAWLRVPLGRLDIPQESRQETYAVDLSAAHLAVIGASSSGKTMLLRTLLLGLAMAHSPCDLWCYIIDAGGQGLSALADLPHVGGIIPARDRERVRRLVGLIDREIARRQELFRAAGASDLPGYRRAQGGQPPLPPLPAWVIVIDTIALLREEFKDKSGYETITGELVRLARVGRPYGVHFVIAADSPKDMTHQLLSLTDARIALRLPELYDYNEAIGGRPTSPIPATLPGRGLCMAADQGILELHVALPLLERGWDHEHDGDDQAAPLESELNAELKETIAGLADAWRRAPAADGAQPARIELLPDQLALSQLDPRSFEPPALADGLRLPLGRDIEQGVGCLSLSADLPHALIVGGPRSGKTTALQTALLSLARCYRPAEARLIIIDPRRRLRSLKHLPHAEVYASGEDEIAAAAQRIGQILAGAPSECRWLIAIDDYDIGYKHIEGQFRPAWDVPNLFGALKRALADGSELGVHLLIAANLGYPEEAGEIVKALDAARSGLILWPHKYENGVRLLDIALPLGDRDLPQPPGRALLVREDGGALIQTAADPQCEVDRIVEQV